MKIAVELNRLLLKFVLLCQLDIQESSREDNAKFNFLGISCKSKKVLKSAFFRLSKSLKSRILATMVPPPGYTGFIITNFPFEATQRLERMSEHRKFEYFSQP